MLCRLDRSVSNSEWTELFPSSRNQYLKFEGSDHRPLLSVEDRLTLCRRAICTWSKQFHENSQKALEETREQLGSAMSSPSPDEELIHGLNLRLLHLYKAEESFCL